MHWILREMVDMNDYGSWAEGLTCYEQLRIVDDINYSESWAKVSGCHEQLKAIDDMNESLVVRSRLWTLWKAQGYGWYQQLRVSWVDGLNAMNCLGLWMILTILHFGFKPLDAMNSSRLWMTWAILGCELKALDAMNNSRLWMIWTLMSSSL